MKARNKNNGLIYDLISTEICLYGNYWDGYIAKLETNAVNSQVYFKSDINLYFDLLN